MDCETTTTTTTTAKQQIETNKYNQASNHTNSTTSVSKHFPSFLQIIHDRATKPHTNITNNIRNALFFSNIDLLADFVVAVCV
jgi:hypothetical protein